jgi:hypothetical protein
LRLRVEIRLEMAPSFAPDDAAEDLAQDIRQGIENWLARQLAYHPDAGAIETVYEDGRLELHLRDKILAVVTVSVVGSPP